MNNLTKYLNWMHMTATGLTALTYIMGFIGFVAKFPTAWFGLCKFMFGLSLVSYGVLFIMMIINAFKK